MVQDISSFMMVPQTANPLRLKIPPQFSLTPVSHESEKEHYYSMEGTYRKTLWIVCFQFLLSVCLKQANKQSWLLTARLWELFQKSFKRVQLKTQSVAFGQSEKKMCREGKLIRLKEGLETWRNTHVTHGAYVDTYHGLRRKITDSLIRLAFQI